MRRFPNKFITRIPLEEMLCRNSLLNFRFLLFLLKSLVLVRFSYVSHGKHRFCCGFPMFSCKNMGFDVVFLCFSYEALVLLRFFIVFDREHCFRLGFLCFLYGNYCFATIFLRFICKSMACL